MPVSYTHLYPPEEPAKADKAPEPPAGKEPEDEELPKDLKIPLTKEGQPETVTTMKVANIRPFEGHPFAVRDNKDMWDLVDSIKKFGVLEPVMVIPHKDGGYEMVSGHRRMRACQLAGIEDIPVIVRNLDRDEAIISMVDSNLKREEISPMEKARAYQMKTDAMKRKMGRRTKEEIAQDEAMGIKRMSADEELAQQVGESPATIQRYKTLNKLVPELHCLLYTSGWRRKSTAWTNGSGISSLGLWTRRAPAAWMMCSASQTRWRRTRSSPMCGPMRSWADMSLLPASSMATGGFPKKRGRIWTLPKSARSILPATAAPILSAAM